MNECHECKHDADVKAGKYKDVPFAETPCATCELRESSMKTQEFDDERAYAAGPVCELGDAGLGYTEEEQEPMYRVSGLRPFVQAFMALRKKTRDTLALRFQGLKLGEITTRLGGTPAGADRRLVRGMAIWPLGELFPAKTARAKRRRMKPGARAAADAHRAAMVLLPVCDAFTGAEGSESEEGRVAMPELVEAVRTLLLMQADVRDGVCWRFLGWTWKQVGRMQGVPAGVASMRLWRGLKKAPAVRVMLAVERGGSSWRLLFFGQD